MRLINADALKLAIVEEGQKSKRYKIGEFWELNRDEIWNAIDAQPTIEERKNGEWEEIEVIADAYDIRGVKTWASKMKCDQCGFTTIAIEGHFSQYNFCPNCGSYNGGEECTKAQ